jgi:hypothetical protein
MRDSLTIKLLNRWLIGQKMCNFSFNEVTNRLRISQGVADVAEVAELAVLVSAVAASGPELVSAVV